MIYDDAILRKVKGFGVLQYSIDKVISILNPDNLDEFMRDIRDDDNTLCVMYQSGINSGKYQLDAQKFKQSTEQFDIETIENNLIKDFLGHGDN